MLPVLTNELSTSSGSGVSYYMTRCPRKAQLDKQFRSEGEYRTQVGSMFHKLMELYYTNQLNGVAIPVDDFADVNTDVIKEALRLFEVYVQVYPKDEFTVLEAESLYPKNHTQAAILDGAIVSPFTLRLDMLLEFNEEQAAKAQEEGREITAGRYILDFKTAEKTDTDAGFWYRKDRQFMMYMHAYNLLFPETPVQGLIARRVVRHKDLTERLPNGRLRSFLDYVIPLPDPEDVAATVTFFRRQKTYLATDEINLTACKDFRGCPHLLNYRCNQR